VQEFVQVQGGTYGRVIVNLSHLRSFFTGNGVEILLAMNWNPEPTKEPVEGKLTVYQVREIMTHSKLRDQAIFLTMFQGMMDLERFTEFNQKYAARLVDHI
jgi:hypothetical protein